MRIDETKVFLFSFKTDEGDVQFPMRASSREEAGDKMLKTLQKMQVELSMDFPKTQMEKKVEEILKEPISIPPEVLEMRIDTLLGDMGAGQLKGKSKSETIKKWTDFDFVEANYTKIIEQLELIQAGKRELK